MDSMEVKNQFEHHYGKVEVAVRAPGRINLIGEHTDYNDGLVLPAAIDRELSIMIRANGQAVWRLSALDLSATATIALDQTSVPEASWATYFYGLMQALKAKGYDFGGIDCALGGTIPVGAGLSSSAAICCGFVFGLDQLYGWGMSRLEMAKIAQSAEHAVGINCGLMDQYAVLFGQDGQVIQLDCRVDRHRYFPVDMGDYQLVLFNSMVSHSLAESGYNDRRASCEKVLAHIQKAHPEILSVRDISFDLLQRFEGQLSAVDLQRVTYVLEENERVRQASKALAEGRLADFGQLLYASHEGLSKKYEVSCEELDFLVDFVRNAFPSEVLGARMMGGGFGGCSINLIDKGAVDLVTQAVQKAYQEKYQILPDAHQVSIRDGVSLMG
ncbi:MAG: galactokinase [Bacteroidota bacterium]